MSVLSAAVDVFSRLILDLFLAVKHPITGKHLPTKFYQIAPCYCSMTTDLTGVFAKREKTSAKCLVLVIVSFSER